MDGPVAARLLGLRFRIPPGTLMFLLCDVKKKQRIKPGQRNKYGKAQREKTKGGIKGKEVDMVTRLRAGRSRVRIPVEVRNFFFSQYTQPLLQ